MLTRSLTPFIRFDLSTRKPFVSVVNVEPCSKNIGESDTRIGEGWIWVKSGRERDLARQPSIRGRDLARQFVGKGSYPANRSIAAPPSDRQALTDRRRRHATTAEQHKVELDKGVGDR
ncbi:hypothetical protein DM860_011636 [Cuscuta australis]|uniref:Uncharacterized protein n=1 Tax=Cuscuta australis TaxID=267555 RepID=A0A328DJ78_9ASTE|nr:hypothetical protein DM860_011636 [Cuscuta australis]